MSEDFTTLSDELILFCQSNSISLEGLHEILQRHGFTTNDSRHINDHLFFFHACHNEHVNEEIIQCLIEFFPDAASAINGNGETPLHFACLIKNVTPGIIRLLIEADPSSRQRADVIGEMPLHCFCSRRFVNDSAEIEILKLLLKDCSSSAKHADSKGMLPIHFASMAKSSEFCSLLIDAYPGSERIRDDFGGLPIHIAIRFNNDVTTVEYLYKLYPNSVNCVGWFGTSESLPIEMAIMRLDVEKYDNAVRGTADIVRFLLKCDPNIKLQKFGPQQYSLLRFAYNVPYEDNNIDEGIEVIKAIYDAHPELIHDDGFDCDGCHSYIQRFLFGVFVVTGEAGDPRRMTTPDEKGRLPLHNALERNIRLGSIKLLVEGNPSAIREGDNNSATPLQLACEHHDSPEVIEYLVGLDPSLLRCEDADHNTALHYACRGAKYTTIALLLEKFDAVSVSKKNRHSKLPIDLLLESDAMEDRESVEYTDSIFRLLRLYPGTLIDEAVQMRKLATFSSTGLVGKKRKVGEC